MPNNPPIYPQTYSTGNIELVFYSSTHSELTYNYNSYSEMMCFTSPTQALIVFHNLCNERGYGIPIEACIALIGCLQCDVNEAIRATAFNTIH